ncbi:CTD kinase subunit gamma CTK3-domain-containing protein [Pyronema domesticum]|nr:CTD kinase subunit gamma CTK3-domain-containing protein [Pyronema domesticum]
MDAFQCRLHFTRLISNLTASSVAAKQCAQFALKNRDVDEDLFSVILEQLSSKDCTMNTRINILYFIESLCDQSLAASYTSYIKMIQRDLSLIIDAVAPDDQVGAANAETARKVLHSLHTKSIITTSVLEKLVSQLSEREKNHKNLDESDDDEYAEEEEHTGDESSPASRPGKRRHFDETLIQQRMEEDRERHKRLRENIWQIPPGPGNEDWEFQKAWEEAESDLNSDDFEIMREENEILAASTAG